MVFHVLANKNPGDIDMLIVRENTEENTHLLEEECFKVQRNCYTRNNYVKTWYR